MKNKCYLPSMGLFLLSYLFLSVGSLAQGINNAALPGRWRLLDFFYLRPAKPTTRPNELLLSQLKKGKICFSCEESPTIKSRTIYYANNTGMVTTTYSTTNSGDKVQLPKNEHLKSHFRWGLADSILCKRAMNSKSTSGYDITRVLLLSKNVYIIFSTESIYVYLREGVKPMQELLLKDEYYIVPYVEWLIEHRLLAYRLSQTHLK